MSTSDPQTYPDPESYFTIGPYITDPKKFFGREEELRAILIRLRTMQSTSVVGEWRIGLEDGYTLCSTIQVLSGFSVEVKGNKL